jgi:hypothetical protein
MTDQTNEFDMSQMDGDRETYVNLQLVNTLSYSL